MIKEELINVFKYIVKKCDMLINNDDYEADDYTQNIVEDIAELCNHILDEGYRKLIETKKVDLDNELDFVKDAYYYFTSDERSSMKKVAKHFYELGLKAKGE